jgi:uncharacterized membrane protein YedE/YeeE
MNAVAVISGLIFGAGLLLSGMSNPAVVLGFLDILGPWRPDLAFVMAGGLAVGIPMFAWLKRRETSLLCGPLSLPPTQLINGRLVLGAAMFGVGWGLAGFCPGPALVALSMGYPEAWIFGLSMLVGMAAFRWIFERPT